MSNITKYRKKWLIYHKSYEKRALKELMLVFRKWNRTVIENEFTENNIKGQLLNIISNEDMYGAYFSIYFAVGLAHGQRVGKDINAGLKEFTLEGFMQILESDLPAYLRRWGITRVQLVHSAYVESVYKLFNQRLKEGKTLKETTEEIFQIMRSPRFYRYEAERIARTETTAAANNAAIKAGDVSGYIMHKRWISALDARTRTLMNSDYDHRAMNGVTIPLNDMFQFKRGDHIIDLLAFPGDPIGDAGNVINCRCTVAVVPARDKRGNLIRTNDNGI
jgi:hypothetical protein